MLKVRGNDANFKIARFENAPGTAVWHPADDIAEGRAGEDGVHLRGKVGDSGEGCEGDEGVFVDGLGEVSVVEEGGKFEGACLEVGRGEFTVEGRGLLGIVGCGGLRTEWGTCLRLSSFGLRHVLGMILENLW